MKVHLYRPRRWHDWVWAIGFFPIAVLVALLGIVLYGLAFWMVESWQLCCMLFGSPARNTETRNP